MTSKSKQGLKPPKKRRGVDGSVFALLESEEWWRDRYRLLESRGYCLRERLHPDWVPSWTKNPLLRPEDCEDSIQSTHPSTTVATRLSDGLTVCLKKLEKNTQEAHIVVFVSRQDGAHNNCVPVLEKLEDDTGFEILVMPLLRRFFDPPFFSVEEVVDFIRQTLEGLVFLHSKNVAHRDCSDMNIMLDGSPLFPYGFHPIYQKFKVSGGGSAVYINRSAVPGVKYYFTDFGLSSHFTDKDEPRLVTGRVCAGRNVPELSDIVPYDPFSLDIFLLGDVYRRRFIEKYSNMTFLSPLTEAMVQQTPAKRPSSVEALKQFEELVAQQSDSSLRWRLIDRDLGQISRFFIDFKCANVERILILKHFFGSLPHSRGLEVPKARLGRPHTST